MEHGTLQGVKTCHCSLCKKAKADYTREYRKTHPRPDTKNGRLLRIKRAALKLKTGKEPEVVVVPRVYRGLVHGTRNGYQYYKCKCALCRKAHAEYMQRRNGILAQR